MMLMPSSWLKRSHTDAFLEVKEAGCRQAELTNIGVCMGGVGSSMLEVQSHSGNSLWSPNCLGFGNPPGEGILAGPGSTWTALGGLGAPIWGQSVGVWSQLIPMQMGWARGFQYACRSPWVTDNSSLCQVDSQTITRYPGPSWPSSLSPLSQLRDHYRTETMLPTCYSKRN